jgi:UDP-N-acetyl-D-mannosaminuronate dehydrogenase
MGMDIVSSVLYPASVSVLVSGTRASLTVGGWLGGFSLAVTIVVGMGEVGKPLHAILERKYRTVPVDLALRDVSEPCAVLHICFPFQIGDFIGEAVRYIRKYKPELTIVNSTVAPGTTRKIHEASGAPVAYSPVRGKHARMEADLLRYRKFVVGSEPAATETAVRHFAEAGFKTATFASLELGELAKLLETTYLGILVGWAQEVDRLAAAHGGTYGDVNEFIKEIDFLPSEITPGYIGGHCVMPNIEILRSCMKSSFLEAVVESNEAKRRSLEAASAVGSPR